jgi:hypothetical protein
MSTHFLISIVNVYQYHIILIEVKMAQLFDLRGTIPAPTRFSTFQKPWSQTQGVTIHRTACLMGNEAKNWYSLDAHIGISNQGSIFVLQPLDLGIWHAQKLSLFSIGIEIEGNPEGFPGYFWHQGGGPHPITDEQLAAADLLFDFLKAEFDKNNTKWEGVWAHRQSDLSRESDPGYLAWQKIGVPWREKLGCPDDQLEWHDGTGQPIPNVWDPKSKHPFWQPKK